MLHKIYSLVVLTVFAAPNLYYAVTGQEDFPFTCNPMFAHYIGDESRFYNFRFVGELEDHARLARREQLLPLNVWRQTEITTMRYFFARVYGSSDDVSPFGDHVADSVDKLEGRLSLWFRSYVSTLRASSRAGLGDLADMDDLRSVRLEVWRFDRSEGIDDKRVLGRYDVVAQDYKHLWHP